MADRSLVAREMARAVPLTVSHEATMARLPDGTRILASNCFVRAVNDAIPDFGLVRLRGLAANMAGSVYRVARLRSPGRPRKASELIKHAYRRARAGQTVEVGRLSGHGRTGTIIMHGRSRRRGTRKRSRLDQKPLLQESGRDSGNRSNGWRHSQHCRTDPSP